MINIITTAINILITFFAKPLQNIYDRINEWAGNKKVQKCRRKTKRKNLSLNVIIDIMDVKYNKIYSCNYYDEIKSKKIYENRVNFCNVDATPTQCEGFEIVLKNLGTIQITCMSVTIIGKMQKKLINKKSIVYIPPQGEYKFVICDVPYFPRIEKHVVLNIECVNNIGYFQILKLDIQVCSKKVSYRVIELDSGYRKNSRKFLGLEYKRK